MNRAWFYHRTTGGEKGGRPVAPWRGGFFWNDLGRYFRIISLLSTFLASRPNVI